MADTAHERKPNKFTAALRSLWIRDWIRFIVVFLVVKGIVQSVEGLSIVQRAMLPGVDIAMLYETRGDSGRRTVVVGITADDVSDYFGGQRPLRPDLLLSAVRTLLQLEPAALVVDVFTEDTLYSTPEMDSLYEPIRIRSSRSPVIWAQSADTSRGYLLRVLGGKGTAPGASAIAAMLAEEDGLVRRVRLRFRHTKAEASDSGQPTLAYAAVLACSLGASGSNTEPACKLSDRVPSDTTSVALRSYLREPTVYPLSDVLFAARSGGPIDAFKSRVIVLGFVDGSDQVATPYGIRPGPRVVADAIETLTDDRPLMRRPPGPVGWAFDFLGAFLVFVAVTRIKNPYTSAFVALLLTAGVYVGARLLTMALGYWTSATPVMVGVWLEELGGKMREAWKKGRIVGDTTATGPLPAEPSND